MAVALFLLPFLLQVATSHVIHHEKIDKFAGADLADILIPILSKQEQESKALNHTDKRIHDLRKLLERSHLAVIVAKPDDKGKNNTTDSRHAISEEVVKHKRKHQSNKEDRKHLRRTNSGEVVKHHHIVHPDSNDSESNKHITRTSSGNTEKRKHKHQSSEEIKNDKHGQVEEVEHKHKKHLDSAEVESNKQLRDSSSEAVEKPKHIKHLSPDETENGEHINQASSREVKKHDHRDKPNSKEIKLNKQILLKSSDLEHIKNLISPAGKDKTKIKDNDSDDSSHKVVISKDDLKNLLEQHKEEKDLEESVEHILRDRLMSVNHKNSESNEGKNHESRDGHNDKHKFSHEEVQHSHENQHSLKKHILQKLAHKEKENHEAESIDDILKSILNPENGSSETDEEGVSEINAILRNAQHESSHEKIKLNGTELSEKYDEEKEKHKEVGHVNSVENALTELFNLRVDNSEKHKNNTDEESTVKVIDLSRLGNNYHVYDDDEQHRHHGVRNLFFNFA